jgi:hypothetical protein
MWLLKRTLVGLAFFIAGLIAYILCSMFVNLPSIGGSYDIRGLVHIGPMLWLALVGSIVVCCVIFKFLPAHLKRK